MRFIAVAIILVFSMTASAQIEKIEPPYWWTGFKDNSLQLLVKSTGIVSAEVSISSDSVTLLKVNKGDSPNYVFLDLIISENTGEGYFDIKFIRADGSAFVHSYELKPRLKASSEFIGFNSFDAIYLVTPDRFANGDPKNDIIEGMREEKVDRNDNYARHGGDLMGLINHLDYIDEMGFTSLWSSPLLTNDMPQSSYHGYAITDYYEVDPRFGTFEDYLKLSELAAEKGIKIIMDQVANHCGLYHWWMEDLPFEDWINFQKEFMANEDLTSSNHRRTINQDPYASQHDENFLSDGWFVSAMPDLNQRNPFMAKYLIQNSIWWIESLNLGGIRQDTYPYPDKDFMADWAGAIMNEYPNFNIVGEEWSYNPLLVGYWQQGSVNKDGYESNLKTTMDFPMQRLITQALNEPEEWDKGLIKIYEGLANDFHYANPNSILLFSDNHDMDRIFTQLNEDFESTKMAMGLVLTLPRIPQIYYGTEILMSNSAQRGDHGLIRTDFPGGWQGDEINAFTANGLNQNQKDMQSFLKSLLNYRKKSDAIARGETVHFAPEKGTYVLFRQQGSETVMLIINKNEHARKLKLKRFKEMNIHGKTVKNIISNQEFVLGESLLLPNRGIYLLTTKI